MCTQPINTQQPGNILDVSAERFPLLELPEDILGELFAKCVFTFDELVGCALTCRALKRIIEKPIVGERLFATFPPPPKMEGNWMKVYRYWIHFAEINFFIETFSSMANVDDKGASRRHRALEAVREQAESCVPFAKRGVCSMHYCNIRFLIRSPENTENIGKTTEEHKTFSLSNSRWMKFTLENIIWKSTERLDKRVRSMATHIFLHSDFDIQGGYEGYRSIFEEIFNRPDAFTLTVTKYGNTQRGNEFIENLRKHCAECLQKEGGSHSRGVKRARENGALNFNLIFPELQGNEVKKQRTQ